MEGLQYRPPKGTVPTLIHDIYGMGILCYFPPGDTDSPQRVENAIRQSQLNDGKPNKKKGGQGNGKKIWGRRYNQVCCRCPTK